MVLPDAGVLVPAFRTDAPYHSDYLDWLETVVGAPEPFAVADPVLAEFIRIVTHPRVFRDPSQAAVALRFADALLSRPNCVRVSPGPRHWGLFTRLLREGGAGGNLVRGAYLAALAIESGCEWVSTDRSYARFPGLRVRHPFD